MKAISAALATLLLTAAPAAFAANTDTAANPTAAENDGGHESAAQIKAFEGVQVSLPEAIAAAEKHTGGKALEASFEDRNGRPAYAVKTYGNDAVWSGMVDAKTGQVIGQGKTTPASALDQEDKAELTALNSARTTLSAAVRSAERQHGGKAIDAGLEQSDGRVAYELRLVRNGQVQRAAVDPATGRMLTANNAGAAQSGSSMRPQNPTMRGQENASGNAETRRLNQQELSRIEHLR